MDEHIHPSIDAIEKITGIVGIISTEKVHCIFEFGSRYGEDTIEFAKRYPMATIHSFECNPKTMEICRENTEKFKNIIFNQSALADYNGEIKFYPINKDRTVTSWADGNQGASSLLKSSGKYPVESYNQDEVIVECITLDTYIEKNGINLIDLMWIDVQGAELIVLNGLKKNISKVKVFHIEVEFFEIYKNQPLFKEVEFFLVSVGFIFLGFTNKSEYSADAVFLNRAYVNSKNQKNIRKVLIQKENSQSFFSWFSNIFYNRFIAKR
jgi:FkbM family methyltransferase